MVHPDQIKPNTPVIASNHAVFGVVDRVDGTGVIRLNKDSYGQHHFIPLGWVKAVTDKVHIDRPVDQALREWTTHPSPPGSPRDASADALDPKHSGRSRRRRSRRSRPRV